MARRQLLDAGATRHQVALRIRNHRLHEIHRGVYLVGHAAPPPLAFEHAALLACGVAAVLGHRSAGALWGLLGYPVSAPVCVTVPRARRIERPGIDVHRADLESRDIRCREGLAVTSPPRTVLDLASELGSEDLEQLVAEAHYRRLASEAELRSQVARNPRRRGVVPLGRILEIPGGPSRTRSPAERRMLRLLRRAGVTGFETNARIHGYEVDVLWRELDFAVEIDGYEAHSGRGAFERDRLKVATLKAHGVDVLPVTPRQLRNDAEATMALVIRSLRRKQRRVEV